MTWTESNLALQLLKNQFCKLPLKSKNNTEEYETLAKPLRAEAIRLNYIRIAICRTKNYE